MTIKDMFSLNRQKKSLILITVIQYMKTSDAKKKSPFDIFLFLFFIRLLCLGSEMHFNGNEKLIKCQKCDLKT